MDRIVPDFDAKLYVGNVAVDVHQVKNEQPWDGDGKGDAPNKHDQDASPSFGDLAFERPPNGQKSGNKKVVLAKFVLETSLVVVFRAVGRGFTTKNSK